MKKILLAAALSLMVFTLSFAQYRKLMPFELACGADLIVTGKISALDPLKFTVEISQVVAGSHEGTTVAVPRYINTKAAKRWAKYAEGEMVMLFLRNDNGNYKIMGEGGEGEKLIMGEEICLDSRGEGLKNRFGYHATPSGANIYAEKVPMQDFIGSVQDVRGCAKVSYVEKVFVDQHKEMHPVTTITCEPAQKDAIYSKSWVYATMMEQAEKVVQGAQ